MFKYLFKRDTIFATIMVFVLMGLLSLIPLNTHVLDPIKLALQDFDYNDMAYSKFGKSSHTGASERIVVVNIEDAGRAEIAEMLRMITAAEPLVTGVDVLFSQPKDPASDSLLSSIVAGNPTVVLAYQLTTNHKAARPEGFLYEAARSKGFANFVGEAGGTIRHFPGQYHAGDSSFKSFSAAILEIANPGQYASFIKRKEKTTQINYSRAADKFATISGRGLLNGQAGAKFLKGKIVLLGYVPTDPYNVEDKHFTPLNQKAVGKSIPDMAGVYIHANIIEMMIAGNFVNKWPVWLVWTLAVLLCWLHMSLFIRYFLDKHIWFHLVAKMAQLISAVLIVYLGLLFYYKWDIKINLTPSFVAIILAVDVLYFYEALVAWLHKKFGFHSLFVHHAH
ncbi:MAG: CHASE2 domain-containing protein [Chitinophagaceae bacterium]|nr:MAG: CHASE2 domain-containing protein [Chitinophagaceae bacterium]